MNWQDIWESIFGCSYKQLYEEERAGRLACLQAKGEVELALADAKEVIRQLELIVPRPVPPKVDLIAQKDTAWVQQVIDGMNLGIVRLPLDQTYYLTNQSNFLNIVAWDWVDTLDYIKEKHDCENFAFLFKSHIDTYFQLNQVGLVIDYKSGHAYNLVIYPNGKVMVLEPQSDVLTFYPQRLKDFYSLKEAIVLI